MLIIISLIPPPQLCRGVCWLLLMSLSTVGLAGWLFLALLPSYLSPPPPPLWRHLLTLPNPSPAVSTLLLYSEKTLKKSYSIEYEICVGRYFLGCLAWVFSHISVLPPSFPPKLCIAICCDLCVWCGGGGGGWVKEDNKYDLNPFYTTVPFMTTP